MKFPLDVRTDASAPHVVAFGKSPARHIKVTCVRYSDNPDAKIFWNASEPKTYKTSTYPYLLPSRSIVVNCPFADNSADPAKNTDISTVLGVVQYEDDTKHQYVTPFCFKMIPRENINSTMRPCPEDLRLPDLK
jgi:hypothetical protein